MVKRRVLVVEDDRAISELISYNLARENFEVVCLYSGEHVVEYVRQNKLDLIVLDIMLPEVDGLEICRLLRAEESTSKIPVLMLTAKGEESDVLVGLQIGADDYMTKPFSPKILLAKIKALLRMVDNPSKQEKAGDVRQLGGITIDLIKHKVTVRQKSVPLTSIEFDILEFLSRWPGRAYTREQILDNVWREGKFIVDRAVDVHIRGLRKKLMPEHDWIETVRGVGYRCKDLE